MKILYIITQGDVGGAQKYTLELAKHFYGAIATGTEKNELVEQAKKERLTVFQLPGLRRSIHPFYDFSAFWQLVKLIKTTAPDIIHLNSSKAGFLGSMTKALIGNTKVVYTAHGFVFNEPLSPFRNIAYTEAERLASHFRDHIIAVSERDRQSALDRHVIDAKKISVVYNGLPPINFFDRSAARASLKLPPDKIIVGTIANLYPAKGIDNLIKAAAHIEKKQRQNLLFVVIGDGALKPTYRQLIHSYGLQNTVGLVGSRPSASRYLKAFDVFALPSHKEGFPFAILEALAAGLPIVATAVGGVPEALGEAGILVPPNNPKALAETLQQLVSQTAARAELSYQAFQRSHLFTLDRMLAETAAVYHSLLKI